MTSEDAATLAVTARLTPRQVRAIKLAEGVTVSEWIRGAVEDRLAREMPGYAR